MKKISQAEARRLKKRVEEMEQRERIRMARWWTDYPGGVHIRTIALTESGTDALDVAQKLQHVLIGKLDGSNLHIYAVPK